MSKIYGLMQGHNIHSDEDYDGVFLGDKLDIALSVSELKHSSLARSKMQTYIQFTTSNPNRLSDLNMLYTNTSIDVISVALVNTIKSVGSLDVELVPARFIDSTTGENVCEGKFVCVYLNEFLDCLDYDKSIYKMKDWSLISQDSQEKVTDRMRKKVRSLKKMILLEPKGGFPPYFKLLATPVGLYISSAAYHAIVKADLKYLRLPLISDF